MRVEVVAAEADGGEPNVLDCLLLLGRSHPNWTRPFALCKGTVHVSSSTYQVALWVTLLKEAEVSNLPNGQATSR